MLLCVFRILACHMLVFFFLNASFVVSFIDVLHSPERVQGPFSEAPVEQVCIKIRLKIFNGFPVGYFNSNSEQW